jgi:hypothetical protein
MSIFSRLFGKREEKSDARPTAFPVNYLGPGPYAKTLDEFGVVFEDDGETGYFYATDASRSQIFDALHIYNRSEGDGLIAGEEAFVVFSSNHKRVGLFFREKFQAVFDFETKRGVCRTGFPPTNGLWSLEGHKWDNEMIKGLEQI